MNTLKINNKEYGLFPTKDYSDLPYSLIVLAENILRNHPNGKDEVKKLYDRKGEILFYPSRILMQDFTGVPAVVDLAMMRDIAANPNKINPKIPVDLVIDHSIIVDSYGQANSQEINLNKEFTRNKERYSFLKWAQNAFDNLRIVPPGRGICHQVNIEHLAPVVFAKDGLLYFDSIVGTDSHTTMVNSLGVLGWGVGGIEAESAMLGQPISITVPKVVGVNLTGAANKGVVATDIVLKIVEILRKHGVVEKFVEFTGESINQLSLADRATIANMAPEYGATCGFFPIDKRTLEYLELTGRSNEQIQIIRDYSISQGLWNDLSISRKYDEMVNIDLSTIETSVAGPKRPQDRITLKNVASEYSNLVQTSNSGQFVKDGDIVVAAITSCTNTSNPDLMIAAGIVAKKANALGLEIPGHVKTSLAPGSQVVGEYLSNSGLQKELDKIGFNIVGYGCTTCIGNSGDLLAKYTDDIVRNSLNVASVLSGNRNFEGRIHPLVKANFLASPPLVIIYALAGNMFVDLTKDSIQGKVRFEDLWPSLEEIDKYRNKYVVRNTFTSTYENPKDVKEWTSIVSTSNERYNWDLSSTYLRKPNYFELPNNTEGGINDAQILMLLGNSVTTDHISPAGSIAKDSEAANYLRSNNIPDDEFNSYGSRRGNHKIMMRGTFANVRIVNHALPEYKEGGYAMLNGKVTTVFQAAQHYLSEQKDVVIVAGTEYGTGSSRDWAAKGTKLLGVKAVLAKSFERIHRSNLVGMGVIPVEIPHDIELQGNEKISLPTLYDDLALKSTTLIIQDSADNITKYTVRIRVDTQKEEAYLKVGGILQYAMNNM